ncbi:hypothetical protein [Sphingomonas sp.]|uniref:hypothetical protein n=1 Tax=Sphingomonas sp. TaxID=28214 RepID=UPI00286B5F2A|nr:hypothetical protein [Sphingomonas sp.]
MNRLSRPLALLASLAMLPLSSLVAAPGASGLTIANATGQSLTTLSIRRTGTQSWRPLPAGPIRDSQAKIPFTDPDCAFDIKAILSDGAVAEWTGVNLCEAKLLTLNRNASGATWVDYD